MIENKKSVLIVEQDIITGLNYELQLRRNQFVVHRVNKERDIVAALMRHHPDVVVVSTHRNDEKSCYEWAKYIRCEFGAPTIVLSSFRQVDLEQDEFFYYGTQVLQKPVVARELKKAVINC